MTTISEHLQAARALIEQPGTWCTGHQYQYDKHSCQESRCALGALYFVNTSYRMADSEEKQIREAVVAVLRNRIKANRMPKLTRLGSNHLPTRPFDLWTDDHSPGGLIAAFNNSTDQQTVLALFDEAIAIEQAKEREAAYSTQVKDLMKHALVNAKEEEPELCPAP